MEIWKVIAIWLVTSIVVGALVIGLIYGLAIYRRRKRRLRRLRHLADK